MTRTICHGALLLCAITFQANYCLAQDERASTTFTRIAPVAAQILDAATAFPGGGYAAQNILDVESLSEYASHHKGEQTFIDFDLGRSVPVAAFRHVQRRTIDTIAGSQLIFSTKADFSDELAVVEVVHVEEAAATTYVSFTPIEARYVRWQVTSVLPGRSPNVGGRSIEFFVATERDTTPQGVAIAAHALPIVRRNGNELRQRLKLRIHYPYAECTPARLHFADHNALAFDLRYGTQSLDLEIEPRESDRSVEARVEVGGQTAATARIELPASRRMTIYILPHSHTDIGYTAIQTDIEEKQINNLLLGLDAARRTADYPDGARFVWNVEVLWAADLLLERLPRKYHELFHRAIKDGQIALNGMYLNELTGLCRPEELIRLFRFGEQLEKQTGIPIDSAMISDVPGYTWGTVTAMQQAGIRYFSVAPNYFDRIGTILTEWENRPFWWMGPDGQSKVLVWIPFWGYALSHRYGEFSPQLVDDFCAGLVQQDYPYDIAYVRWAGQGDNGVPDASVCDFVKQWNVQYASPRFIIASTSDAFHAMESHYGKQLPEVRGDWTPYWEDGAGSSASETAMNRASSDRLVQAEALWAMLAPKHYPVQRFNEAWKNVLLYSEHTWGAHCSISQPARPFTSDQWHIKRSFALAANLKSRQLVSQASHVGLGFDQSAAPHVDVFNTTSWPRTEVAYIPHELARGYAGVVDECGDPVVSQPLAGGELAVLVRDIPPFSGRRLSLVDERPAATATDLVLAGNVLKNSQLAVRVDQQTGAIAELRCQGIDANLVDTSDGRALNDYLYLIGDDPADARRNGPVQITVHNLGPLVASLLIESEAPGCHKLIREVRLVAHASHVELINIVDKKRLAADSYGDPAGKESVNFAFPMHVPDGEMRLDVPFGVVRPEHDQMKSACKNWLTIGRWADVANPEFGITWVSVDAPLIQLGGLTATLLNSQTDPSVWRKHIEPTQQIISWVMNNHWGTNYRAYQEGPVTFRFVVRPHLGPCNEAGATRFATGFSQPLVVLPGRGSRPPSDPLVRVGSPDVLVTGLKPSDDGRALILRLFGAADQPAHTPLAWAEQAPFELWLSNTGEQRLKRISGEIEVPARGVVTLRAEIDRP